MRTDGSTRLPSSKKVKRPQSALEAWDRTVELDPQSAYAWKYRGSLLITMGRLPEALASFDRVLAIRETAKG